MFDDVREQEEICGLIGEEQGEEQEEEHTNTNNQNNNQQLSEIVTGLLFLNLKILILKQILLLIIY